jgi:hypothetical protein
MNEFIELCTKIIEKENADPKQNDELFKTIDSYYTLIKQYDEFEYNLFVSTPNLSEKQKEDILKENRMQEIHKGLLKIGENRGFDPDAVYDDIDTEWFVDQYR